MRIIKYIVAVMVLLLPFTVNAFGEEVKQETSPAAKQAPEQHEHSMGTEKRAVAVIGADGVQHVEITGGEYFYDPNYIVVKVNVPVELKVKKTSGYVPHDIVVKAPDAGIDFKTDIGSKDPAIIKFTPTKVGKYPMYCDKKLLFFKSHRERGMDGMIEVVE